MSYDSHSKQILLIAIVHILGYILYLLAPATTGMKVWQSNEVIYSDSEIAFTLFGVSLYILMIVLACVMVRGVVKQRHVLIAPWLIMSGLILVATIATYILNLFLELPLLIQMDYCIYSISMQILVLYPTYTYYMKLRPKSLKENSFEEVLDTKIKRNDNVVA
ncbi:hypothetical protein DOY81_000303 [Sarcophaga bullata]|nr:hypothetical protein DOY81_000303 [Sarcophaga bullata]